VPGRGLSRLRIVILFALGLAGGAGALRADLWYVHYENAERALADEKWREAVKELRQAIERKGDSGVRVRSYGMKVVDYFPYLKLGIAYHHLGQESAALEAFDTEERLGVVQGAPAARRELERYRQMVIDAQREVAGTARRRTEEIIEKSLADARRLEGEGRLQDAMNALGPGLAADPEQRELKDLMARLSAKVVAEEEKRREAAAAEALRRFETVTAVDPGNVEAPQLRERLAEAREAAQPDTLIRDTLRTAGAHFAANRFEEALSAANQVLALDRKNPEALGIVQRAYARISQRLLETSDAPRAAENIPPAIRFADQRQEVNGERIEVVESPAFRLNGVAIDSSPVTVAFLLDGRPVVGSSSTQVVGETYVTELGARATLEPGAHAWTVIATDSAGLSSRSQYAVVYRRPWFQAPWLFPVSAGSLGLGVAGLLLVRWRKHRRRRARKFNPYVAGGPIFDEGLFYGREPLIQKILQTVHNNSLLLHGERRIGKTSLLHQVQRRLEALDDPVYAFHPVYIDLQGTPEEKFFATLADQIFEALETGDTAREPALARAGYSHHDLVRELHGLLRQLKERSTRQVKVVLLIDEVDELNDYDPRVSQSLRSLFMKRFAENLAAVVAGVRIRKEWEKETSPWYNFFEEIEVEALAPEAAARLVAEPVRGTFRFEAGAAERIVALSGGKPFQIQRRCLALVQRLHEEGRRTVTRADVEALERENGPLT